MDRTTAILVGCIGLAAACLLPGCSDTSSSPSLAESSRSAALAETESAAPRLLALSQKMQPAAPRELEVITAAYPIENYREPADESFPGSATTISHGDPLSQGPTLADPEHAPGAYGDHQWFGGEAQPSKSLLSEDEASTKLPWAHEIVQTPEMKAVEERATSHIRRGMELGQRGALYSARAEFIQALQVISGALDGHQNTRAHSQSLAAGLQAMDESKDFIARGASLEADLDLKLLIDSHRTPVLHNINLENLTTLSALQRYYTYAQEQLAAAVAKQPSGSAALYALGRLQTLPAGNAATDWTTTAPRAVVFYQAALTVNSDNILAANELGVLLARFGRYRDAKDALLHGAMSSPQPAAWHNLAVIHRKLGETQLAERAEQESKLAAQAAREPAATGPHSVRWVDPETFARDTRPTPELRSAHSANHKPAAPVPSNKKVALDWLPWAKPQRQ